MPEYIKKIAYFPHGNQKDWFATTYYLIQEDLLSESHEAYIKKNFCNNGEYPTIKNDECEKQFLDYIHFLNIDLYIFQCQPSKKNEIDDLSSNQKSLAEIHRTRKLLASFLECDSEKKYGINYCYYVEPLSFSENEKNHIKKNFCNKHGYIENDESHDQFLKYCKEKNILFKMYQDNRENYYHNSHSSSNDKNIMFYNLNEKDLEAQENLFLAQALNTERQILNIKKFKVGYISCSQEAAQFKHLWQ